MEEFKFVLKCFLFSCVLVIFSQTRISGETLENKAFAYLQHSQTAQWVRDAADGGIKIIRNGANVTKNFIGEKIAGFQSSHASHRTTATAQIAAQPETNTGLFRKLERNPERSTTQQRGMAAESLNSEQNLESDQY